MVAKLSSPPDATMIAALWEQQKLFYNRAHQKMLTAQQLYDHTFPGLDAQVPQGLAVHLPSTASSIIDHFRDNVRVQQIVPERDEFGTSKAARERLALLLRIDQWVIRNIRQESSIDPFSQTVFDMSLRGASCWRIRYVPERQRDEDTEAMLWPISVVPVDPLGAAPAPGGDWPLPWIIEHQKRTASELLMRYGSRWPNTNSKAPSEEVDWYEYWSTPQYDETGIVTPGWYVAVADGDVVISMENPYGVVPYVFEFSGMGRYDSTNDPMHLAVNLLEKAESELWDEARMRTALSAIVQFTAFPRLLTTEDPREVKLRWDLGPGGVLQVRGLAPDQKPQWMEQPELPAALFNFLPLVQRSIERATFSSVMEGQRSPGVDYGYLQALLVGQASLRKDNIIGMASRLFARGVGLIERILVHLELGPFVLGPGLTGEPSRRFSPKQHIGKRTKLQVKIEASDPAEKDRRMLAWLSPRRAGQISQRTYLKEGMLHPDPDEEIAQIHAETVLQQIVASGQIAQEVLAQIAAETQAETVEGVVEQRLSEAQEALQGAPGVPPTQESPVTPSPMSVVKQMQSANQRATSLEREG